MIKRRDNHFEKYKIEENTNLMARLYDSFDNTAHNSKCYQEK